MAEDEATEEVAVDEEIPVDDVLADAQETLDGIEGAGGADGDVGGGGGTSGDVGLEDDPTGGSTAGSAGRSTAGSASRSTGSERSSSRSKGGGWLPSPSMPSDVFSTKHFLIAAVLAVAGGAGGTVFLPIPIVGTAVGLIAAGFLLGLASGRSSYVEVGLTTGLVGAALVFVPALLSLPVGGLGVPLFAIGAIGALLLGVIGHYFGRDLRSGLTRDVGGDDDGLV